MIRSYASILIMNKSPETVGFKSLPAEPARPRREIREEARVVDEMEGVSRVRFAALRAAMAANEVAIACCGVVCGDRRLHDGEWRPSYTDMRAGQGQSKMARLRSVGQILMGWTNLPGPFRIEIISISSDTLLGLGISP